MHVRQAILIGIDESNLAPSLGGAVQDVLDVARRLQQSGAALRILTSPRLPAGTLPGVACELADAASVRQALEQLQPGDEPTLVHVSARGCTTEAGPHIALSDALLPLSALCPGGPSVRTVCVVVDAGFGGGEQRGERSFGATTPGVQPLPELTDTTLLAGGLSAAVYERRIAGRTRGVFTRMLTHLLDDRELQDHRLAELLTILRRVPGESLSPMVLPAEDAHQLLGAPVPWRGVEAVFQWQPTHGVVGGFPTFTASDALEEFNFGGGASFPPGQFSVSTEPGAGNILGAGPGVHTFTNLPFDQATPIQTPPTATGADRVYAVTASWGLPGSTYVIFRNAAAGDVQGAEWFTTSGLPKFDVAPHGTVTFTESPLPDPTSWQQAGTWHGVAQAKQ